MLNTAWCSWHNTDHAHSLSFYSDGVQACGPSAPPLLSSSAFLVLVPKNVQRNPSTRSQRVAILNCKKLRLAREEYGSESESGFSAGVMK